jgi:Na+/proline symporter
LAVGLNWQGATKVGAIASILTGLIVTLSLEISAYVKLFTFPAGVTASAVAMVASFIVFFVVSWTTRHGSDNEIDDDVKLVMAL